MLVSLVLSCSLHENQLNVADVQLGFIQVVLSVSQHADGLKEIEAPRSKLRAGRSLCMFNIQTVSGLSPFSMLSYPGGPGKVFLTIIPWIVTSAGS